MHSDFKDNIICRYGDEGRKWLDRLDIIVNDFALKWHLRDLKPLPNLTFNYVLSGVQNETPVILKIGIDLDLLKKANVLNLFRNHGAVRVIESCDEALLLERCIPGYSLMEFFPHREDESIEIITKVIKKLHSLPAYPRPKITTMKELLGELYQPTYIPEYYISKAIEFAENLLQTPHDTVMHGDLHQDNVIFDASDGNWKVIDPFGVIGDPVYEFTPFMTNPIDKLWKYDNAVQIVENRIRKFADFGVDPTRLRQWAFIRSVLCLVWTPEEQNLNRVELVKLFDKIV